MTPVYGYKNVCYIYCYILLLPSVFNIKKIEYCVLIFKLYLLGAYVIMCVHMCVYASVCVCMFVFVPENNLMELVFSFFYVEFRDQAQLTILGRNHHHPFSHLLNLQYSYMSSFESQKTCFD